MRRIKHIGDVEAILAINPSAEFIVYGPDDIEWIKGDAISRADIDAKLVELEADWTAQEYAHNRQDEYPHWSVQLNKIYDDGLTKWKSEMIDPIKAKWPKDNSGPK